MAIGDPPPGRQVNAAPASDAGEQRRGEATGIKRGERASCGVDGLPFAAIHQVSLKRCVADARIGPRGASGGSRNQLTARMLGACGGVGAPRAANGWFK